MKPSWEQLVQAEPRLADLLERIQRMVREPDDGTECRCDRRWFGNGFKEEMMTLVGHVSNHPVPFMCTSEAYRAAYDVLYGAIPACRWCRGGEAVEPDMTDVREYYRRAVSARGVLDTAIAQAVSALSDARALHDVAHLARCLNTLVEAKGHMWSITEAKSRLVFDVDRAS